MVSKPKNPSAQESTPSTPAQEVLSRIVWLKFGLLLFFAVVAGRLVWIQVIQAPKYQEIAKRQYEVKVPIRAKRGNIYDRNGKILVESVMAVSYAADPKVLGVNRESVAERFALVFGKTKEYYLAKLEKKDSRFEWLERRASLQTISRIRAKEFDGLIQTDEPKRIYHYDHVAGQALGFTDIDNNGLSGIELEFDKELRGRDGYIIMQRDGLGRKRPVVDYPRAEPVNGNNIVLTLALEMQSVAEEELRRGIERNKATGGVVVMLEPKTGEVLAMANAPSVNPNNVHNADQAALRNRAITDMFEPGSVFKIVTVSAALEHHLISPQQTFFAENGTYKPRGRPQPIEDVHKFKNQHVTFRDAVEFSSNVVMAKASDIIGPEKLYRMARDFGFGTKTGFDLPGEVGGQLKKPTEWSRTTLNTMAYGYEVGVTPLQIAAAYGAVANGGTLMKPYIVKQIVSEHNEVTSETSPEMIRKVISSSTADTLRDFLRGVVERGSGIQAKSATVMMAGKTGTSRKHIDGQYSKSSYTASFVGLFPADNPHVVCLVMLDNPKAFGFYGGYTSAPIVKNIAEKLSATLPTIAQRPATPTKETDIVVIPDVRSIELESATHLLESLAFDVETSGEGAIVLKQSPAPGTKVRRGETIRLVTQGGTTTVAGGYTVVPDLRGLSLRRALNRLTIARLDVEINGSGVVASQSIKAGEQVKVGTRVAIHCVTKAFEAMTSL